MRIPCWRSDRPPQMFLKTFLSFFIYLSLIPFILTFLSCGVWRKEILHWRGTWALGGGPGGPPTESLELASGQVAECCTAQGAVQ